MAQLNPYLNFNGTCREAMTFYQQGLGGELLMSTFGESPVPSSEEQKEHIMHAQLTSGDMMLMASDAMGSHKVSTGDAVSVSVNCDSIEEIDRLFAHFSQGSKVTMPLDNTFWGARFGMLTDKFGINWMFNHQLNK